MKQSPYLAKAQLEMQPGSISNIGFLGDDKRNLQDILNEDAKTVAHLGVTHAQVADVMEKVMHEGKKAFGNPVLYKDFLQVTVESSRGKMPCPFGHPGMYPKEVVCVTNQKTNESMCWTALSIHMIRQHGFYQGKGSSFRIEPEKVVRVLEIVIDK